MALKRIVLRDFVIVEQLDLDLAPGFTALTGETGAGKSILVDALQIVTGARADAGMVREGRDRMELCAEFDCPAAVVAWLDEAGFDATDTLLLRRVVDRGGKSRAWINGSPATATQLRALGERLLDIHGQHAWQGLTRPEGVRALLDAYAGVDAQPLRQAWQNWRGAERAFADARAAQDQLQQERDRLSWQIGELSRLAPQPGEWEALQAEHTRLSHAQSLLDAAHAAIELLQESESAAVRQVHQAAAGLRQQSRIEPAFAPLVEVLDSSLAELQDSVHVLRAYLRKTDPHPQRLAELDQRMGAWMALARRYRRPPEDLPALLAGWQAELARLDAAGDLAQLEASARQARDACRQLAQRISRQRQQAAPRLARAVTAAMQGLGMEGGCLTIELQPREVPQTDGLEEVKFLVAGHAGTTPRPIGKVASGGELSRIALAIAVTTSDPGSVATQIFDEVDSGIGGAVAQAVGRLMRQLGQDRQVLAVTHLPQVAACADHHLVVSKRQRDGATLSTVAPVEGDHRVAELARMLGGEKTVATTRAHAAALLQSA